MGRKNHPITPSPHHPITMQHLLLALLTYLSLAAHAACGHNLAIGDCCPPLMWLPVVLAVTWFDDVRGCLWGAMIGLLADGLSDGRFGVEMLAITLATLLMAALRPDDDVRSTIPWRVWQFGLLGSGLLLSRGLSSLLSDASAVTLASLLTVGGEAIYGLTIVALFAAIGRLFGDRINSQHLTTNTQTSRRALAPGR